MVKQSGLGADLLVGGYQIGNDVGQVNNMSCPHTVQDVTGLDKLARETRLLLRDGQIGFTPFFNDATGRAHPVLSALPTTDTITTFLVATTPASGPAQGDPAYCLNGKQIDYNGDRATSGELLFSSSMTGNGYGSEWCEILTDDGVTDSTGAENLGSLDGAASSSFGLQAYLHVLAFTGTSITVTIEDSSDDISFAAVTGGAFTAATGVGAERVQTARDESIDRYLRCALTGTYSAATILVAINRNATTVNF